MFVVQKSTLIVISINPPLRLYINYNNNVFHRYYGYYIVFLIVFIVINF